MVLAKFAELSRILIDDINVVERCVILDVIKEVPLRAKYAVDIDEAMVLKFDSEKALSQAWDCLQLVKSARLK